jgi:uncharacterized membrane protein YbaN (DUF454 family)
MACVRASALATAGFVLLSVGCLGIVLPLLPTTPFFIAAAACFSRASPRFERWLVTHPRLGHPIRAWRTSRAIPTGAKFLAITSMGIGLAALVTNANTPHILQLIIAAVLAVCTIFIISRPARK